MTVLAAIADRFEEGLDLVLAEMDSVAIDALPASGRDQAMTAEIHASNSGNIRQFLALARSADDPPPFVVAPEALDVARTLVRRGIESDVVYQSYRRGQQVAWQQWMACAEAVVGPGGDIVGVLNHSLAMLFGYVDDVLGRVIAEMQREREAVLGGALARRTETVRLILDGAPLDREAASRRIGYDLARRHTALVLWSEERGVEQQGVLESAAGTLAQAAGARRPLTLPAGTTTLWAWIGSDTDVPADVLRDALGDADLFAAVGPTQGGVTGFRRSHEAALSVHRLLAGNPESSRFATYEELEVTALAAHDQRRAAEFVSATLGPLAADTPNALRLRETLRVFLEEAEHAPRAAARLHTHRNTVLQRVARATDLLGYRPGERRLAVELALELRRRLGPVP